MKRTTVAMGLNPSSVEDHLDSRHFDSLMSRISPPCRFIERQAKWVAFVSAENCGACAVTIYKIARDGGERKITSDNNINAI